MTSLVATTFTNFRDDCFQELLNVVKLSTLFKTNSPHGQTIHCFATSTDLGQIRKCPSSLKGGGGGGGDVGGGGGVDR